VEQGNKWRVLVFLLLLAPVSQGWTEEAAGVGEKAFNTTCFACHTIGGGRLVGPDLIGIQDKRSHEWLVKFISSSQTMVGEGDSDAIAIVEEYNGLIMPDALLSTAEIEGLLSYIAASGTPSDTVPADVEPASDAEPASIASSEQVAEQIGRGRSLFDGTLDFENGGATCNACHHVVDDAVLGGGTLAAELTTVFSRMGAPGIRAIVAQAPFPAMQAAYADKPLTEAEVFDLTAYLQHADAEHMNQTPRNYGMRLFAGGVVGSAALFGFCGLVWRGRKRGSVNQDIYDRQLKSE
jgi:mono/diheme cytochrome c family protein